MANVVDD